MSDNFAENLSFKSEAEAEAWAKWFLRKNPLDSEAEFTTEEEYQSFLNRRFRRLRVQLDDLARLEFEAPQYCEINENYTRIVRKDDNPLSTEASNLRNSRFNYKESDLLKNRVVYFGQDKLCCFSELFHLNIQTLNYENLNRSEEQKRNEIPLGDWEICEFRITVPNVLVLTTQSTYDGLHISPDVVKNEWYAVNDEYDIPTSGQLLATIVRKRDYNGILYRSVRNQLKNSLVLFEDNFGPMKWSCNYKSAFSPQEFCRASAIG